MTHCRARAQRELAMSEPVNWVLAVVIAGLWLLSSRAGSEPNHDLALTIVMTWRRLTKR